MQSAEPPFGLSSILPAFDRATWLAKTLFGALDAAIVLIDGEATWRSRAHAGMPPVHPAIIATIRAGEEFWVEDLSNSTQMPSNPVMAQLGVRSCFAAPIRLDNGATPGALCVVDSKPRPYDPQLAKALCKLAQGIADECNRLHAAEAALATAHELTRTRTLLTAFVEGAPISFALTDRDLRVLKANPRCQRDFGWGEDFAGKTLHEIDPARFGKQNEAFQAALAGGTLVEPPEPVHRDGAVRWLQTELAPWRQADGEIGGLIISAHDVTELMEAIGRSERLESHLKIALEAADIWLYEIDYANQTQQDFGNPDSLFEPGQTIKELYREHLSWVDPRDRDKVRRTVQKGFTGAKPVRFECRVNRSDGQEVWANVMGRSTWGSDGKIAHSIGAILNVTARKQAEFALLEAKEQAEAANLAKSTFLATMSHEIRTPLNGVLGMAQAMQAGDLSDVQRERLAVIRQSGESLLSILNDVLDLSKIEAGKLELEEIEFDVGELARGTHAAFTAVAEAKGLTFDLTISPAARGAYRGDSGRIRQILYNLISNALKFTERGGVYVRVHRRNDQLLFTVSDSGIGIRPDRLESLFSKFEQADTSTTRRFGGTGLGLAICRELAMLMGGDIEATSQEGEGATFQVSLPLSRIAATASAAPTAATSCLAAEVDQRPLRVLAAEDNRVNQLVLTTLLQQVGVTPHVVENGVEAVEAWEDGEWDVILMDVHMPEMDGPAATQAIRAREAATGRMRIPIIALTANVMSHQIADYVAAGMDGFVAKPIEVNRLFAALDEVLSAVEAKSPMTATG